MKVGDLITYKQSPDNQVYPCPWDRMGIILRIVPDDLLDNLPDDEFEVYWYGSGNIVAWQEQALELVNENR